jgi:signal peptidase II
MSMIVPKPSKVLAVTVFFAVVALDQISKTLVLRNIGVKERVDVVGPLSLVLRYNRGVAFSIGNGSAITAWVVTIVVAGLLVWVVRTVSRGAQPLFAVLLAVIAGGGVGNQLDRLFRGEGWNNGAVIDFIDTGVFNFAIFNVADMALSVGCFLLAVWTLFGKGPDPLLDAKTVVKSTLLKGLRSDASLEHAEEGLSKEPHFDSPTGIRSSSNIEGAPSQGQPSMHDNDSTTKGR